MKHSESRKKAQLEVRQTLTGKSNIVEVDLADLHYLKHIVKETLRMHSKKFLIEAVGVAARAAACGDHRHRVIIVKSSKFPPLVEVRDVYIFVLQFPVLFCIQRSGCLFQFKGKHENLLGS